MTLIQSFPNGEAFLVDVSEKDSGWGLMIEKQSKILFETVSKNSYVKNKYDLKI